MTTRITSGNVPHCPNCRAKLDAMGDPSDEDAKPCPGDASVCLYCGLVFKFDSKLEPCGFGQEEFTALPEEVLRKLFAISAYVHDRNKKRAAQ